MDDVAEPVTEVSDVAVMVGVVLVIRGRNGGDMAFGVGHAMDRGRGDDRSDLGKGTESSCSTAEGSVSSATAWSPNRFLVSSISLSMRELGSIVVRLLFVELSDDTAEGGRLCSTSSMIPRENPISSKVDRRESSFITTDAVLLLVKPPPAETVRVNIGL